MRPIIAFFLLLACTWALPAHQASRLKDQPPGIRPDIYNCTYPSTGLSLNVSGFAVGCGSVAGRQKTFTTKDIKTQSDIQITLRAASPERLYAAFLLNPLAGLMGSFLTPILHMAAGNIPGSSLANGNFEQAVTISHFFPPNPPLPGYAGQFVYLVFLQPPGPAIDWSNVTALCSSSHASTKFPIEAVANENILTLVASNYFAVEKEWA